MADALRPVDVTPFPNGEIGIRWSDGHESYYDAHALRCACACASCVDEMTGHKVLDDDRVPRDVRARGFHPVGNYGVAIVWSDGHETGIYTFARLRELCGCGSCAGRP
ncbi:MAG TPA: DUF971 domain-containing protein [Candidatus Polarisedimenticolaceae bacterium]|nr:DUF971 domain-containing protein [Candidatus Polarisedimenticolaceae bacterium]